MPSNDEIAIQLTNISKTFFIREKKPMTFREKVFNIFNPSEKKQIQALKNINLEIKKGEFFGIMGLNGSGKSTLLRIIAKAYQPDKGGQLKIRGQHILLSLGLGFNQELTARQNVYLNCSILGLTLKQIGQRFHRIIEFAELEDFIDTPIKYFSSGMLSRLKFAIAVQAKADIFLMDEFFGGVGDERFKEKSEKVFRESLLEGRTIIHVSHRITTIREHCHRVLLLHKGEPLALGTPKEVIPIYRERVKGKKKRKKVL